MRRAIDLAVRAKGLTYPNPCVGAVVAHGRRIVGYGYHKKSGGPHAEVEALRAAGDSARGADLYVTLEPCDHFGKTPPCTEAIIASGIRRVFVPTRDPNPMVKGKGIRRLRREGIEVYVGLCSKEARRINEEYFKYMLTGQPFVTLKIAQTLDGKVALRDGRSKWVTSASARRVAKAFRAQAQAVLIGINTVLADDPMLLPVPLRKGFIRCVLDTNLRIPPQSRLVRTAKSWTTIIYCASSPVARRKRLEGMGVIVQKVGQDKSGRVAIDHVLEDLAERGVMHVMVEGGGMVLTSFMSSGYFDKLLVFVAPKIFGNRDSLPAFVDLDVDDTSGYPLRIDETKAVGQDLMMILYPARRLHV